MQNTEMFAGPGRREPACPLAQFGDVVTLIANGRADGIADAVQQLALWQLRQFPQASRAATWLSIRSGPFYPLCLRFDFRDRQQIGVSVEQRIEWCEIDRPGSERFWPEDGATSAANDLGFECLRVHRDIDGLGKTDVETGQASGAAEFPEYAGNDFMSLIDAG